MDIAEQNISGNERHPWELARLHILIQLVNRCLPFSNEIKMIADIGCGDCFFASELLKVRSDVHVIAIDTAYSSEEIGRKKKEIDHPGFDLFNDSYAAAKFLAGEEVHLFLFLDVVEHIEDDATFLKDVVNLFKVSKDTLVLVSVPAFQSLFTNHDVFLRHFRRYNRPSIKKVVQRAGLMPIESGYYFLSLLPLRLIQKIAERLGYQRQQKGIGAWKRSSFVTKLLKNYLLFDYKFSKLMGRAGIKLPGLSVYCICKKLAS